MTSGRVASKGSQMLDKVTAGEIGAEGIGKTFGHFTALDGISLTVGRGEFLTLLGPSGSGKTTFLMILAGFEAPTSGRLTLNGLDVTRTTAEDRGFGMVFQGYALFPHMSVEQNIAFPLKVQKRSAAQIRARTDEMIEMVGLGGHGHKKPAALSGGQQQRVALARALAYEPPVLLLDEPFSALDRNLRGQMQDEMRRIHRDTGTTFVFVTHDQEEALALSTRVAIFNHGRLQQIATPREIYDHPDNRFVAEFLGDINVLPLASVVMQEGAAQAVFEGVPLRVALDGRDPTEAVAVRPEHMHLALARPAEGNAIPASVREIVFLGAETRLTLASPGGQPLVLSIPSEAVPAGLASGAEVWVGWPEDKGVFV